MFLDILKIFFAPSVVLPPLIIGLVTVPILYWHLKKRRSQLLVAPGIGRSDWFTVSGGSSHVYYDIDKASSNLDNLEAINQWYVHNIREIDNKARVDFLAFIEREDGPVGAITKKDKISGELGIPSLIVRPKRRILASRLKGVKVDNLAGKQVVIVSDVATTGHSVKEVIRILGEYNVNVVGVVTIVYRHDQGEGRELKKFFDDQSVIFRYSDENLSGYEKTKEN